MPSPQCPPGPPGRDGKAGHAGPPGPKVRGSTVMEASHVGSELNNVLCVIRFVALDFQKLLLRWIFSRQGFGVGFDCWF